MASGHVNRIKRPDTWLHRPMLQNVKKVLANPEPSTHGTFEACRPAVTMFASGGRPEVSGAVKVTRLTRCGHRPDRNLAVRRALIWILPIRCYAVTCPRAAHAFRSAEETSFTCGARSPDPWELMLIRLAKRWEQECSRKGSRPWA